MQHALGPEGKRAGIMRELRLVDLQHQALMVGIGLVRVIFRDADLGDMTGVGAPLLVLEVVALAQRRAVIDVELAVVRIVRMKGEAERAALVETGLDRRIEPVLKVEKRCLRELSAGVDHPKAPDLLEHQQAAAIVGEIPQG